MEVAVGITLILLSIVHVVYGEKRQVAILKTLSSDSVLIGSFRTMSLQGGFLLCAIGAIYILSAMGFITLTGAATYFPLGLVLINVLSLWIVALTNHLELLRVTVPQLILFCIIITLQILIILRV